MTKLDEQQARDESEIDWTAFKIILCVVPALFLLIAIVVGSWSTVIGLLIFAPVVLALVLLRRGRRRSVTLHVAMALLLGYQVVLLRATVAEPNIGLVWFLSVPAIVGLLGNRTHVLIWTPAALACLGYCWTLYSTHPTLAHPLALPNLLAVAAVIGFAALGMILQRDRREQALKEALLAARTEARDREAAELASSESRAAITRFLGSVSHELRTPLTSIVLSTDVLDRGTTDPEHRTWISNIRSSAQSLVILLNDVLDLAHSDAGREALQAVPFALEEMLEGVRAIVEPLAIESEFEWFVGAMPDVPQELVGDAARLRQVLVNLVSNALRHSGGTRVWLSVATHDEVICFAVGDNGRGIAAQAQREIFQPFRQLEPVAAAQERKGTGLGLTIAAGYVEAMGGALHVRSAPGEGAVFEFSLPLDGASSATLESIYPASGSWPDRVELVEGSAQQVAWAKAWLEQWGVRLEQHAAPLSLTASGSPLLSIRALQARLDAIGVSECTVRESVAVNEAAATSATSALHCAVCDDEPAILRLLEQILLQAGHAVASFEAPQAMLAHVEATPTDVIVLDVNLGAESGLDALRRLRANPATASVPVCMLSGRLDDRDACLAAGADDYLVKPSGVAEILKTIARLGST